MHTPLCHASRGNFAHPSPVFRMPASGLGQRSPRIVMRQAVRCCADPLLESVTDDEA
jgi:hypothetical protein